MVKVFLEGSLGRRFGREWELDVKSPTEALRAININVKGALLEYLSSQGNKKYYKFAVDKKKNFLTKDELSAKTGKGDIYVIPTIKGAGDNGLIQAIVGVALIALTWYAGGSGGWAYIFGESAKTALTIGYGLGASLVLGGVMQLLTPTPSVSENSSDQSTSNLFQGNASTIAQGGVVPLIYGRSLVSPMPISLSITNIDKSTSATQAIVSENTSVSFKHVTYG